MSNKSRVQQSQQQSQNINQQQQSTTLKKSDTLPPQYQPPPHPTIGILKNHPNFCTTTLPQNSGIPSSSSSTGLINQQQVSHPSHLIQQQQQQQQQSRLLHSKDAQGKFTTKIEHLIPSTTKNSATGFYTGKSSGQYLPPNSQYPTSTTVVTTTTNKQRISDEEFLRLGPVEMLKFVRKTETDIARLAAEQNRQIQSLLNELRILKEANQRLSDDNQELRDLCCFLDDDRQKGRKLAREWQRFGRYTASVMRQEVSAYQNKLRQLDNKQQELIKDNLELKELCLYLDEERGGSGNGGSGSGGGGGQRDDGDGSSSSTNAEENLPSRARHAAAAAAAATFNDQTMQYVRSLEQRVKQLEEDKNMLQARAQTWELPPGEIWDNPTTQNDNQQLGGRPEAVVRALQVLEVREQLEREAGHDNEKALVREMCNVVWRKLEETSQTRR